MCGIYGRISFTSKIESLENTDLEMETNTTLAPSSSQNENLLRNKIFQLFIIFRSTPAVVVFQSGCTR